MTILIVSFTISLLALNGLLKSNLANIAIDEPNYRSLHTELTPRSGGLALMLGVLTGFVLIGGLWFWIVLLVMLMLISLFDDIYHLPMHWRFIAHLAACICFIWIFLPQLPWWVMLIIFFSLAWMTNLYNFMDGSDGLAGGMAVIGFGVYALAAYSGQNIHLALMCSSVVVSSLAFLFFNFHPAKIFMGDAGSIPLGFLAGTIGIYGHLQALWPVWFPILVFSPFIIDSTVTLLKRILRKEKIWQAHREHYYQRLVQMGWGHKKTAIAEYVLMALIAICALLMLELQYLWVIVLLLFWSVAYFCIIWKIDNLWKRGLS